MTQVDDKTEYRRSTLFRIIEEEMGLSINAAAVKAGIPVNSLRKFKNGINRSLNIATYEKLSAGLGVSVAHLQGEEDVGGPSGTGPVSPGFNEPLLRYIIESCITTLVAGDMTPATIADVLIKIYKDSLDDADEILAEATEMATEKMFSAEDVAKIVAQSRKTAS